MRISDWSSDVCSSDLPAVARCLHPEASMRQVVVNIDHMPDQKLVQFFDSEDRPLLSRVVAAGDDILERASVDGRQKTRVDRAEYPLDAGAQLWLPRWRTRAPSLHVTSSTAKLEHCEGCAVIGDEFFETGRESSRERGCQDV